MALFKCNKAQSWCCAEIFGDDIESEISTHDIELNEDIILRLSGLHTGDVVVGLGQECEKEGTVDWLAACAESPEVLLNCLEEACDYLRFLVNRKNKER